MSHNKLVIIIIFSTSMGGIFFTHTHTIMMMWEFEPEISSLQINTLFPRTRPHQLTN